MTFTTYRPDIDGLRAIAVLTVIAFHFNNTWLPGGFIGVDMFFVISGYIITRIIYTQMESQDFSFSNFYIKRIKRILPLFYLVSTITLLVSWLILTPDDLVKLAGSIRYASGFVANVYFERDSGYFAPAANTQPLLHLWSLSVEEQFYFIWPLLLVLLLKYIGPKHLKLFILLSTLIFIATSEHAAQGAQASAYYSIQNRAGELLIGALLSILVHNKKNELLANSSFISTIGMLGLLSLVGLFIFLDESSIFPGINAAFVSVATAALILNGELGKGCIYSFLSSRAFVFIGRLSFSLYLWHWPVLVLYRYYFNNINTVGYAICATLTFSLAFCSWRFFERPLRYLTVKKKWVLVSYLVLPILILIMVAKDIKQHRGYENRLPDSARRIFKISITNVKDVKKKTLADSKYQPFNLQPIGDEYLVPKNEPSVLLWGDSHAGHFVPFVEQMGLENEFYGLVGGLGGCPPFIGVDVIKHGKPSVECTNNNNKLFEAIKNSKASVVLVAGRWAIYTETTRSEGEKGSRIFLGDSSDYSESLENTRRAFRKGMEATIQQLIENKKSPIIFEQVPEYSYSPSNCLIKKATYSWMQEESCNIAQADVIKRQSYASDIISEMESKYPQLEIIRIKELICRDGECVSEVNTIPLYNDDNHINMEGSKALFELYKKTDHYKELRTVLR